MTDENTTALPYRNGIRVAPEEPAEPLPDFLTIRFDELVARDRADWEANVRPPTGWQDHVAKHFEKKDDGWHRRTRIANPSYRPFLLSLCLIPLLGIVWLGAYLYFLKYEPGFLPTRSASAACGIALLIATFIAAKGTDNPAWALKHIGVPPLSLYLTFRELLAWRAWRAHGKRWQYGDWSQTDAVNRIAMRFRSDQIAECDRLLHDLRTRERQLCEEAKEAGLRMRGFATERDRLGPGQEIHAEQLSRSIQLTQERADALSAKAGRLKALGDEVGVRIASLRTALEAYVALQCSRLRLRETNSLDESGMEDLRQLALVREEYRQVQNLLAQVESIIQGTATRTIGASNEDELTARIHEAAARTGVRS